MKKLIIALFAFAPIMAFAGAEGGFSDLNDIIIDIFTKVNKLFFALAGLVFGYAVIKLMFMHGDDEKAKNQLTNLMLYSIGALVIMVSVWGLVKLVQNTFFDTNKVDTPVEVIKLPGI